MKDVATITEKMNKIERDIADIRSGQSSAVSMLGRIETTMAQQTLLVATSPMAALKLGFGETRLLWEVLGLTPQPLVTFAVVKVGEKLQANTVLLEFPNDLISKIPQLTGLKYTISQNTIVIVDGGDNRVMAIIPPMT